jgi:hypothetical protein
MSQCDRCKLTSQTKFSKCNRCQLVSYCSKECQTIDWKKNHKRICLSQVDKFNVSVFGSLKDAINKCNVSVKDICSIISRNNVDMKLVANKLLLEAASAGNKTVMGWLLLEESNLKLADVID